MYKGIYPPRRPYAPRAASTRAQAAILALLPARAAGGPWAEGLTLADLARNTGLTVPTVRHALNLLRVAGRVHPVAVPKAARWDGQTGHTLVWFRTQEVV